MRVRPLRQRPLHASGVKLGLDRPGGNLGMSASRLAPSSEKYTSVWFLLPSSDNKRTRGWDPKLVGRLEMVRTDQGQRRVSWQSRHETSRFLDTAGRSEPMQKFICPGNWVRPDEIKMNSNNILDTSFTFIVLCLNK